MNKAYRAEYTTTFLIFASPRHVKFSFETIVFAYVYVAKVFSLATKELYLTFTIILGQVPIQKRRKKH